jgi:hypothetical protein
VKKVTRYPNEAALAAAYFAQDPHADIRAELAAFSPEARAVNHLFRASNDILQRIVSFVGNNLRTTVYISNSCRRLYYLCFEAIRSVTLVPDLMSVEQASRVGALASFAAHVSKDTRGQHIDSLSIMGSRAVYNLPRATLGPSMTSVGLQTVLNNVPYLTKLDVRGVVFRSHAVAADHFLADLRFTVANLKTLKIGPRLARSWEAGWWAKLPQLTEFVIGSRREDIDWHDQTALGLPDDFMAMLRSPHHRWESVKIWCSVTPYVVQNLLLPAQPFAELCSFAINVVGNTAVKPLEDPPVGEVTTMAADKGKKADPKSKGKEEGGQALRSSHLYPKLIGCTIVDTHERPEFASEVFMKLCATAPNFRHFAVVNTSRAAPGHRLPVQQKSKRTR